MVSLPDFAGCFSAWKKADKMAKLPVEKSLDKRGGGDRMTGF